MSNPVMTIKHCGLPIECPAACHYMREIQDEETKEKMTFCDERPDTKEDVCPYSIKVSYEQITGQQQVGDFEEE